MKIVSIVGTRPQFLKLIPLAKKLKNCPKINHIVIHSGQHYDKEMSENIFSTLGADKCDYYLDINRCSHGEMTAKMMVQIEKILIDEHPDYVFVYGDCNTTLAGALCSVKLGIKTVHIEAGLRSYNRSMPEEINRIVVDRISDILCCPNSNNAKNLENEGLNNIHITGNLQIDLLKYVLKNYNSTHILKKYNLEQNKFILLTIHRHYNTNSTTIKIILNEISKINCKVIFPIHPRTKSIIEQNSIKYPDNIVLCDPVNYLDMTILERFAKLIITDSGGVQPEAYFLDKPCLIVRSETEWNDTIKYGKNMLTEPNCIYENYETLVNNKKNNKKLPMFELDCSSEIVKLL